MDKELTNDICDLIAARTPYSFDEVRRQYDRLKSFDLLIASCDYAATHAIELGRITAALLIIEQARIDGEAKESPVGILNAASWWGCRCGYSMPELLTFCTKCGADRPRESE